MDLYRKQKTAKYLFYIVVDKRSLRPLCCSYGFGRFSCGISNALDKTEDDELYTEEGQEIDDDKDNEFETKSEGKNDADGK